jgi:tripartite-type tricarboxylate transporter receptor subunit TctC
MFFRGSIVAAAAALMTASVALPAFAQDAAWPAKPVTIIVPNNPGSGTDLGARLIAEALSKDLGQSFVVENVPGAANTVGAAKVADSPPDGYTFLHASLSSIVLVPLTRSDLTYIPDDFAPVGQTMASTNTLVINPKKIDVKTFAELLEELKKNPGKYNYSTSGVGGLSHLMHELVIAKTGVEITHIPYGGASEATAALVAGEVDLAIISTTPILPFVESGELRAIAVAQPERIKELPDVPSIHEIVPEYGGVNNWNGVFAPAGTPEEIVDKFNASMTAYLGSDEGKAAMEKIGALAAPSSADDFTALIKSEIEVWKEVIASAGLAPK